MTFDYFSSGFTNVEKGTPLTWQKGTPRSGRPQELPAVLRNCLAQLPWAVTVSFEIDSTLPHPESSRLEITEQSVRISAASEKGWLYAVSTLLRFGELEEKFACTITDTPHASRRGLKLYLPPPDEDSMKEFYAIIDLAVRYKYNFIMLELGGAMEYKSHPEINTAYLKYASFMNEYPAKAMKLQNSFKWRKNSIHTDNGGGLILPQTLLAEIINYCEARNLEIIPEVPSLSHCDYILAAHPHLAERKEDPYPDTACPSQEQYYNILFDLLQETVDLFHPRCINIGHDEYYSIGLCPECSKKSAPVIYAEDINRTAAFLRERGVATIIWGDKLLDAHFRSGGGCGGAELPAGGEMELDHVPATFPAIDLIAPDIEIFHWYWSIDRELDLEYDRRNRKFLFGNFGALELPEWKKRSSRSSFQGVCVSNWGRSDYETMRRNGIIFDLICSSYLCWNKELGSEDYAQLLQIVTEELNQLQKNRNADTPTFEICHTAETDMEFLYFFDGNFIDEKDFLLGEHVFTDTCGKEYKFPVIFGKNISNAVNSPARVCDVLSDFDRYIINRQYIEILGGARPCFKDGKMWYKATYPHPDPGQTLTYKEFRSSGKKNCQVFFKEA